MRGLRSVATTSMGVMLITACGAASARTSRAVADATPERRAEPALSQFAAGHVDVLFGGTGSDGIPLGDTWVWDGARWGKQAGTAPAPRSGAVAADDSTEHRVLLFGGRGAGDVLLHDTWAWDGRHWQELHPTTVPTPTGERPELGMGTDGKGRVVLVAASREPGDHLQTWTWTNGDWRSAGETVVPASGYVGPAVDPATGRLLLFQPAPPHIHSDLTPGSTPPPPPVQATWTWDGSRWGQVGGADPEIIIDAEGAMSADPAGGDVIVETGGSNSTTWRWRHAAWAPLHPSTTPAHPDSGIIVQPRGFGMAVDVTSGRPLLFGGFLFHLVSDDTWAWDGATWVKRGGSPPPRPPFHACRGGGVAMSYGITPPSGLSRNTPSPTPPVDPERSIEFNPGYSTNGAPCHLHDTLTLAVSDAAGAPLATIADNPLRVPIDEDLSLEDGGTSHPVVLTNACTLPAGAQLILTSRSANPPRTTLLTGQPCPAGGSSPRLVALRSFHYGPPPPTRSPASR